MANLLSEFRDSIENKTKIGFLKRVGKTAKLGKNIIKRSTLNNLITEHNLFFDAIDSDCLIVIKQLIDFDRAYFFKSRDKHGCNCVGRALQLGSFAVFSFLAKLTACIVNDQVCKYLPCLISFHSKNMSLFEKFLSCKAISSEITEFDIGNNYQICKLLFTYSTLPKYLYNLVWNDRIQALLELLPKQFDFGLFCFIVTSGKFEMLQAISHIWELHDIDEFKIFITCGYSSYNKFTCIFNLHYQCMCIDDFELLHENHNVEGILNKAAELGIKCIIKWYVENICYDAITSRFSKQNTPIINAISHSQFEIFEMLFPKCNKKNDLADIALMARNIQVCKFLWDKQLFQSNQCTSLLGLAMSRQYTDINLIEEVMMKIPNNQRQYFLQDACVLCLHTRFLYFFSEFTVTECIYSLAITALIRNNYIDGLKALFRGDTKEDKFLEIAVAENNVEIAKWLFAYNPTTDLKKCLVYCDETNIHLDMVIFLLPWLDITDLTRLLKSALDEENFKLSVFLIAHGALMPPHNSHPNTSYDEEGFHAKFANFFKGFISHKDIQRIISEYLGDNNNIFMWVSQTIK